MSGPSPYEPPPDGPAWGPPPSAPAPAPEWVPAGPPPHGGSPPAPPAHGAAPQYGAPPPPPPQYGTPQYATPPPPGGAPWGPAPYPYPPAGAWAPYGPRPSAARRLGLVEASFGARLGAHLLDAVFVTLMVLAPGVLGVLWLIATYEDRPGTCTSDEGVRRVCDVPTGAWLTQLVLTIALVFILAIVIVVVYAATTEGRTGQTWGKRIAKVRTVDASTGQPIGAGRAVGRLLAKQFLSGQILNLGFLWMLWDEDKQTWHDKIVRSIVVRA
jgi:uncharacterized RDD family membrane protein YckC